MVLRAVASALKACNYVIKLLVTRLSLHPYGGRNDAGPEFRDQRVGCSLGP